MGEEGDACVAPTMQKQLDTQAVASTFSYPQPFPLLNSMKTKFGFAIVALVAISLGFIAARQWLSPPSKVSAISSTTAPDVDPSSTSAKHEPVLTLPEFSLKNREGTLQSIHSWPQKSLVINFWATWCAPCRREIPLLQTLQQQHAADGVQVVGIAVDFRDDVLKYADNIHLSYPLLIGEQDGLTAIDAFGIEAVGFPFTIFTDNKGDIVTTHLGELHANEAALILAAVQQVNRGEVPVDKARIQISAQLARVKPNSES
jgi:thiol-disulfide isomerase/thioredoxin